MNEIETLEKLIATNQAETEARTPSLDAAQRFMAIARDCYLEHAAVLKLQDELQPK